MTPTQALAYAAEIVRKDNFRAVTLTPTTFPAYVDFVVELIRAWDKKRRANTPKLKEFLEAWIKLRDTFEHEVKRDPAMAYRPQHDVALEFHRSPARWRYFRAGNRTSKTQSGYLEDYWFATGQHPYRHTGGFPASIVILAGLPLKDYGPKVFVKKMIEGEEDNTISPLFPENGKWFYHFERVKNILTLACPECAENGKAQSCQGHHPKSYIYLMSADQDIKTLEAFQARLAHVDEHVPEDRFNAVNQRIASVKFSAGILTGTPLMGEDSWENEFLAKRALGPESENRMIPGDLTSPLAVSLHEIDQFKAGLIPHDSIRDSMTRMDEFEIQARVYGKPAPLARNPVFDRRKLADMPTSEPEYLQLAVVDNAVDEAPLTVETVLTPEEIQALKPEIVNTETFTGLRCWERPIPGESYLIGVDTARGLMYGKTHGGKQRMGDASAASVLKVTQKNGRLHLQLVAQYYGWLGTLDYADEIKKLGVWYNLAMVCVELTGGLGAAVIERLRKHLFYFNLFRDLAKPELAEAGLDARYGLDTNMYTKPKMVAALQHCIQHDWITIPCEKTIRECVAFEQQRSDSGKTTQYGGSGGSRDDRVMSLVMGVYVALTQPSTSFSMHEPSSVKEQPLDQERRVDPNVLLGLSDTTSLF